MQRQHDVTTGRNSGSGGDSDACDCSDLGVLEAVERFDANKNKIWRCEPAARLDKGPFVNIGKANIVRDVRLTHSRAPNSNDRSSLYAVKVPRMLQQEHIRL